MRTFPSEREDTRLVRAAYEYAERGWPVLPLAPREKRPLTRHGLKDASTDLLQVRDWWRAWPDANIGIRTGVAFDVLDLDGDPGFASLGDFLAGSDYEHTGPIGITSKGEHWLFAPTGRGNGTHLLPNIDYRGENGYIVAPPSVHPSGRRYRWLVYEAPLPAPTEWLLELLERIPVPRPAPPILTNPFSPAGLPDPASNTLRAIRPDILSVAEGLGLVLRRHGPFWKTNCVYHDGDRDPSLTLYPDDNHFHCFGCGAHGDSHDLAARKAIAR